MTSTSPGSLTEISDAAHLGSLPSSPARSSACTAIFTLAAPPAAVFRELADIENLPRWAGEFCECVYLVRGRWAALTSLGEMFLALEANECAGEITLWAGWRERELHALTFRVAAAEPGAGAGGGAAGRASDMASETRVIFAVARGTDEGHARLCRALAEAGPGLAARVGGGVCGRPGR